MDQITLRSPTPIQEDEEDEETDMANQQSIAAQLRLGQAARKGGLGLGAPRGGTLPIHPLAQNLLDAQAQPARQQPDIPKPRNLFSDPVTRQYIQDQSAMGMANFAALANWVSKPLIYILRGS